MPPWWASFRNTESPRQGPAIFCGSLRFTLTLFCSTLCPRSFPVCPALKTSLTSGFQLGLANESSCRRLKSGRREGQLMSPALFLWGSLEFTLSLYWRLLLFSSLPVGRGTLSLQVLVILLSLNCFNPQGGSSSSVTSPGPSLVVPLVPTHIYVPL